jgi:hypothetical protein
MILLKILFKMSDSLYMLRWSNRSYFARCTVILVTSRDCNHITWSRNPASVSLLATIDTTFDVTSLDKFTLILIIKINILNYFLKILISFSPNFYLMIFRLLYQLFHCSRLFRKLRFNENENVCRYNELFNQISQHILIKLLF